MTQSVRRATRSESLLFGRKRVGPVSGFFRAALAMMIISLVLGCGARRPPPPPQMDLHVKSDVATNNGQLFYLMARSINDKQFLTESYQTVASMVFADPPDKTVIQTHVILPGTEQILKVEQPEESPIAFYFLFTDPGDQWKKLLDQPLAKAYDIRIEKNNVTINKRKSFWKRLLWPFS